MCITYPISLILKHNLQSLSLLSEINNHPSITFTCSQLDMLYLPELYAIHNNLLMCSKC